MTAVKDRRAMSRVAAPSGAFVTRTWDRPVPEEWNRLLYAHLPSSGPIVLMLAWEPGDPWHPVERWMLYETHARWWVGEHDPDRLKELEGPNPRQDVDHYCANGWCTCRVKKNKLVYREHAYTPTKIDFWQWRFYQQHRRSPIRYWTIQGDQGGHRFALTPTESRIWQQTKGISDTPVPGALPYAPFDARVLRDVVAYEPMRRRLLELQFRDRIAAAKEVERLAKEQRIQQRRMVAALLRDRMAEGADILGYAMRRVDPYLRVYDGTKDDRIAYETANDPDVIEHRFVHDGDTSLEG